MRKALVIAAFFAIFGAPSRSHAVDNAGQMLVRCQELIGNLRLASGTLVGIPNTMNSGICFGYFDALSTVAPIAIAGWSPGEKVCMPAQTDVIQFVRLFVRYAETHPELHHLAPAELGLTAIKQGFPCH